MNHSFAYTFKPLQINATINLMAPKFEIKFCHFAILHVIKPVGVFTRFFKNVPLFSLIDVKLV